MTKKPKEAGVGPWAKEKLDALGQYLNFYTTVLKKQGHWLHGTVYVDAFAGPGLSSIRAKSKASEPPGLFGLDPESDQAEAEFLKGSPRVALDITTPFTSYLFVERDPQRIVELQNIKTEYGDKRRIMVLEADANAALKAWLASGINWQYYRAVVFLDPFGMQVPWSTIETLAKTKAIEAIINFPLGMAIQCEDLFGPKINKVSDAGQRLLEWYRVRLRQAFGHVSAARLIKNTRGNPLYYLIWAGPNAMGLKGAQHILSKGESVHPPKEKYRGK